MELRDSPDEAAFREGVRSWLETNLPAGDRREWSRKMYDAGYAGLTWPKEYGGPGAPYTHQAIALEEFARAEAPPHMGVIGLGMAGPTIMAHGTEEQKRRYLPKILSAEEIWCQGFSEPGAGLRPVGRAHVDRAARRRLRGQRPEGLVVRSRTSPTSASSSAAAIRDSERHAGLVVRDRRHARARRRGAAAAPDHRRPGVQRDLLQRRRRCRARTCSARSAAAGRSR